MSAKLQTSHRDWDTTPFFPEFDGPAYRAWDEALRAELAVTLRRAQETGTLSVTTAAAWTELAGQWEDLRSRTWHFSTYLSMLASTDATNTAVQAELARFSVTEAELSKLGAELMRAFTGATEEDFAAFCSAPSLSTAAWTWQRLRAEGKAQMPVALEGLAADLGVNGIEAWGRLYDTLTGRMEFPMTWPDGTQKTVPMAQRRALMADPDRGVREAAFREGQVPFVLHQDTLAAALNAIAGTRLTLYGHRGQPHFLDAPLHAAALSAASLEAMMQALLTHVEIPRRALQLAAARQGTPALAFYDLEAPQVVVPDDKPLSWEVACGAVHRAFSAAYPDLADYFEEMLRNRWIESAARPGKRPGAYQTSSPVLGQERVYMTWHDTLHDLVTLAHEVGHAWHTRQMRHLRPLAQSYPMTLAETASNFGESVLLHGLMNDPALTASQREALIDQQVLRASANLLNIPMRFVFERNFYEARRKGEVPAAELCRLMTAAQREIYGGTLLEGGEDPYFWASKMHFFITGVSFYNFPYVFGHLLSQALYAQWQREGAAFLPKYEAFLQMTGSASCEACVREALGADLTDPEFWASGIRAAVPDFVL